MEKLTKQEYNEQEKNTNMGVFDKIISWSLNRRGVVVAAAVLLLGFGIFMYPRLRIDVLPDLNRPVVSVLAEAKGLAPEEVETLVVLPIEAAINGAPGVTKLRSLSKRGIAIVKVEFDWGTDLYRNRQIVSERLAHLKSELPKGINAVMGPVSSIMGEIQFIGLHSKTGKTSARDLRTLAHWTIRKRLLGIPGLANVVVIGGEAKEYSIVLSARKLARRNIELIRISEWLRGLGRNTSGGFVEKNGKEYVIRNLGSFYDVSEIRDSVLGYHRGVPVRVKDVGDAVVGHAVRRGDASINGKQGVILVLQKTPGASTRLLTREIDKRLGRIAKDISPDIVLTPDLFKQAEFIQRSVDNITEALRDGSIIVAVILFLFLWNLRTTLITITALPLSLIVGITALHLFGFSFNTMTIGGLVIAVGELVDDAIVDTENVFRRLRENAAAVEPRSSLRIVFEASSEIRNSIVVATAVVILVFVPLFFLDGVEGHLFKPLAVAYMVSIVASLLVALTITPVLCYFLLPGLARSRQSENMLPRFLKRIQTSNLSFVLKKPWLPLGTIGVLFALSIVLFMGLGGQFLPPFNEGTLTIEAHMPAGTSLSASIKKAGEMERILLGTKGVSKVSRRTGRSERDDHAEGVHYSEFEVGIIRGENKHRIVAELRKKFSELENVTANFGQPISHRLEHLLSGIKADAGIFIYGESMELLLASAFKIKNAIRDIPGVEDVHIETPSYSPELKITIRHADAAKYGIPTGQLTGILESLLYGRVVGKVIEKQRVFNIRFRLQDSERERKEAIGGIVLKYLPDGSPVTIAKVADIYETTGPYEIKRENGARRIIVQFNAAGNDVEGIVQKVSARVRDELKLPEDYYYVIGGPYARRKKAMMLIGGLACVSFLIIAAIVFLNFKSLAVTAQILLNLPLAFIGGVLALSISGIPFSAASMVGFVALAGIASRNGILMISHFVYLGRVEEMTFSHELVIRGALERLTPVLMTALTAIFALLPILLGGSDAPGKEILYPVALVIVGGLTTSTLLDVMITPVVFYHWSGKRMFAREQ